MTTRNSGPTGHGQTDRIPDPGPSAFEKEGTKAFVLSREEWYELQQYVSNAMLLPTTETALRGELLMQDSESFEPFQPMLDAFSAMQKNCLWWEKTVFPASVDLADNIVHYNREVSVYYEELRNRLERLRKDPRNQDLKTECLEFIEELQSEANRYSNHAAEVYAMIEQFANLTAEDKIALDKVDTQMDRGTDKLDQEVKDLEAELERERANLAQRTEEYTHNTTVAATTVTYAWVIPFGLIPAIVVAAVYGKRATDDTYVIAEARRRIDEADAQLQRALRLRSLLKLANGSVEEIGKLIKPALKVVQKIQGGWSAIASDLQKIGEIIQEIEDRTESGTRLFALIGKVTVAIDSWADIADKADAYRVHAFIKVPKPPVQTVKAA